MKSNLQQTWRLQFIGFGFGGLATIFLELSGENKIKTTNYV